MSAASDGGSDVWRRRYSSTATVAIVTVTTLSFVVCDVVTFRRCTDRSTWFTSSPAISDVVTTDADAADGGKALAEKDRFGCGAGGVAPAAIDAPAASAAAN